MTSGNGRDLQAVLWDMDGTLVDTEPYWLAAQSEIARMHGIEWNTQDARSTVGQAMPVTASILRKRGVALSTDEIINELLERVVARLEGGIPWLPGAERILAELAAAHIPSALVTMAFSPASSIHWKPSPLRASATFSVSWGSPDEPGHLGEGPARTTDRSAAPTPRIYGCCAGAGPDHCLMAAGVTPVLLRRFANAA